MRTNPKSGTPAKGNPKNGSALPRATRRRVPQPKSPQPAALTAAPTDAISIQDDIARLAYFLWEARGGVGGSPEEDWLRAEQEILTHSLVSTKA